MAEQHFAVSTMHAELDQSERDLVVGDFVSGSSRILICTDLMNRYVDLERVSLVINYDLPTSIENYLHRIGRGGCYAHKGVAINFITNNDLRLMKEIERFYHTEVEEM